MFGDTQRSCSGILAIHIIHKFSVFDIALYPQKQLSTYKQSGVVNCIAFSWPMISSLFHVLQDEFELGAQDKRWWEKALVPTDDGVVEKEKNTCRFIVCLYFRTLLKGLIILYLISLVKASSEKKLMTCFQNKLEFFYI